MAGSRSGGPPAISLLPQILSWDPPHQLPSALWSHQQATPSCTERCNIFFFSLSLWVFPFVSVSLLLATYWILFSQSTISPRFPSPSLKRRSALMATQSMRGHAVSLSSNSTFSLLSYVDLEGGQPRLTHSKKSFSYTPKQLGSQATKNYYQGALWRCGKHPYGLVCSVAQLFGSQGEGFLLCFSPYSLLVLRFPFSSSLSALSLRYTF